MNMYSSGGNSGVGHAGLGHEATSARASASNTGMQGIGMLLWLETVLCNRQCRSYTALRGCARVGEFSGAWPDLQAFIIGSGRAKVRPEMPHIPDDS